MPIAIATRASRTCQERFLFPTNEFINTANKIPSATALEEKRLTPLKTDAAPWDMGLV